MSFLSKYAISAKCSVCGRKIGLSEKRLYFNVPEAPKHTTLWLCKDCSKIKGKAIFLPDGSMKIKKPDGSLMDTATVPTPKYSFTRIIKLVYRILFVVLSWFMGFFVTTDSSLGRIMCGLLFGFIGFVISHFIMELIVFSGSFFKKQKLQNSLICVLSIITILGLGYITLSLNGVGRTDPNAGHNNSNKETKGTCAWCGKKVSADDMRGKWCKDCQNDAFGDDGWYYDIQD